MYTRTFECEGFDGKPFKVTFDFFLSKSDVAKINLGSFVGLDVLMQRLFDSKNGEEIVNILDKVIMTSVGRISADKKKFIRNQEIRDEFTQTPAYDQLFMELSSDMEKLNLFFMSVLPQDVAAKIAEKKAEEEAEKEAEADADASSTATA